MIPWVVVERTSVSSDEKRLLLSLGLLFGRRGAFSEGMFLPWWIKEFQRLLGICVVGLQD